MVLDVTRIDKDGVQDRARVSKWEGGGAGAVPVPILLFRQTSPISVLPAWWSISRDVELRRFAKSEGLFASSVYTMQAIISSTGYKIKGGTEAERDRAREPIDDADYGHGFGVLTKKFIEDWLTQDNGVFLEIEGPGNISKPLLEPPTRINHIDAGRCWRSADPEHPVWYYSMEDMNWHKMHWTRVAFDAPNPSSIELARGLGFCAASRMEPLSNVIKSIVNYKQEKTGGRHSRGIVYGNVMPQVVEAAFEAASEASDNRNQINYSSYPYVGSPMGADVSLGLLELSSLPDGFVWEDELTLYMYCVALALGVDARELWPATASGATRADAEVQHRKAMRKGVGDALSVLSGIVNSRILPDGITMEFTPKDNEEDQEQATIEKTRVETVEKLVSAGITTPRGGLLYLVNAGVLPEEYLTDDTLGAPKPTNEPAQEAPGEEEEAMPPTDSGSSDLPDEAMSEDENDVTKPVEVKQTDGDEEQRNFGDLPSIAEVIQRAAVTESDKRSAISWLSRLLRPKRRNG